MKSSIRKPSFIQCSQEKKGPKYQVIKSECLFHTENYDLFTGEEYQVFVLCFQIYDFITFPRTSPQGTQEEHYHRSHFTDGEIQAHEVKPFD